ncbi:MAG: phytoene desaturase [Gammaproteobacteria bacterium]|nr:phytoene desaturase [Gammaproteobacteria bacterium]
MAEKQLPVIVIGAGIGGLSAAISLASRGLPVLVLERRSEPGGKLRSVHIDGQAIDSGPTVLTMRHVFDELFQAADSRLSDHVQLQQAKVLARHGWRDGSRLDLHASRERSARAIREFADQREASGYLRFCADAERLHDLLDLQFMRRPQPGLTGLLPALSLRQQLQLLRVNPFRSLWQLLGEYFRDPRLRQLFARYATYSGSSPWQAPATLMLIAHVEQTGVWYLQDGMQQLARAMHELASALSVAFQFRAEVDDIQINRSGISAVRLSSGETIPARHVIANCDPRALLNGQLGQQVKRRLRGPLGIPGTASLHTGKPSLSAFTWSMLGKPRGFDLAHHNVFFNHDYAAEFRAIFHRQSIANPATIYVCAQDRGDGNPAAQADAAAGSSNGSERLFCLMNAPAGMSMEQCRRQQQSLTEQMLAQLAECDLLLRSDTASMRITTPADFALRFPGSGGALYGSAVHGWRAAFLRPGSATKVPGLYLCGGSVHPGPGIPMAAISGRLAAEAVARDCGLPDSGAGT